MTVVNPKSISGINSITTGSGSDNLLTIHTSDASSTERVRINSSGDVIVGSGITVSPDGDIFATGVTTSTTFVGAVSGTTGTFTGNVAVSGANITLQDSGGTSDDRLTFGAGTDLSIYHDGTNSIIDNSTGVFVVKGDDFRIKSNSTNEDMIRTYVNGAVELYHNNVKKFETSSSGITISGDNSTGSYIKGVARFTPNDSTTVKVIWDETGFSGAGAFQVKDGVALSVGDSSDLKIYHDGSHSYINDSGTGNLRVLTNSFTVNNTANSANLAQFTEGGSVELFHNGTKQCETSANGLAFPSGKGIDFSAAGNAGGMSSELLDDYEEGTFTPNWDGGGGVTFSYNHQYGWYTKIGNTVTFQLYIQGYAATITGGNENNGLALQGLPFTILDHARYYPSFSIGRTYKFDIEAAERLYAYGDPNSTNARFIKESDDAAGSLLVAQDLNQNTTVVHLSGVYRTDS